MEEFLDSLPGKVSQKITWVLSIVEELELVPAKFFKKLKGSDGIHECRIDVAGNAYRMLGFFIEGNVIILTNGFIKKTQKTPKEAIELAESRKKDFLSRGAGT